MNDWRRAVQQYQSGVQSIAQDNLSAKEAGLRSKASLLSAQESTDIGMAATKFGDRLKEQGNEFAIHMGEDASAGVVVPTVLKYGAKWAQGRVNYLRSDARWREVQAKRFSQKESAQDTDPTAEDGTESFEMKPMTSSEPRPAPEEDLAPRMSAEGGQGELPEGAGETAPGTEAGPKAPTISDDDISKLTGEATSEAEQASSEATSQVKSLSSGAEAEAEGVTEDLAPELSEAGGVLESVAGAAASAIPFIGFGIGLYSLIEGGMDLSKTIQEESEDPYAAIRPKLKAAGNKIKGLETQVSADEFASKIGGRMPQFGSLAASPSMDTSKMQGVALHV